MPRYPFAHRLTRVVSSASLASLAALTSAASLSLTPLPARAENHALIMWIGDYGNPRSNLPGIDLDAANARRLAIGMGVPQRNISELSNAELTRGNVINALSALQQRIGRDDKVFLYYSGHGAQVADESTGQCAEGLVTREPALFDDGRMQAALDALGRKASQVVMMNDSCFSGGAATRALDGEVAKAFPEAEKAEMKASTTSGDGRACGEAVNKMADGLRAVGAKGNGPQVLYIAASAANEVSYATRQGSVATQAWVACLSNADTNRSGAIDGEELRQCAQRWIDGRRGKRQTITLVGNAKLPLMLTSPDTASAATTSQAVDPRQTLEDIRAGGDAAYAVKLTLAQPALRIGKDPLDFAVQSSRAGYLYVLHVGSDGQTFDLLFPNRIDANNQIAAGTHRLPRSTWRVKAGGPRGTSYLLAVVSSEKKDLSKGMDAQALFPNAPATVASARNLIVEATSAQATGSRFGASEVVAVQETD